MHFPPFLGRQVFRCFLHESLAEENLLFVEEVEKMKKEKQPEKIRQGIKSLLERYGQFINLSSVAMSVGEWGERERL
jgi:hypothetical protein